MRCRMNQHLNTSSHLSSGWRWGSFLTLLFGLFFLTLLLKEELTHTPPLPIKVLNDKGKTLFTKEDILRGQKHFLNYNLMHLGSLFGHGALFGVDFTAEELNQETLFIQETLSQQTYKRPFASLNKEEAKQIETTITDHFRQNSYDVATGELHFTDPRASSLEKSAAHWKNYFASMQLKDIPASDQELFELTSFFVWSGFVSTASPDSSSTSYTHNFPFNPLIGNVPPSDLTILSVISLLSLFAILSLLLYWFGKHEFLGWATRRTPHLHSIQFTSRELSKGQRALAKFLLLASSLFLFQTVTGILIGHFRAEDNFWRSPLATLFPYPLLNSWHVESGLFWILTAWMAGSLFISHIFSKEDPPFLKKGTYFLFGSLVFTFLAGFSGEFLAAHQLLPPSLISLIGTQGVPFFGYGRLFQFTLLLSLLFWIILLYTTLKTGFPHQTKEKKELALLFFFSAATLPLIYLPSFFMSGSSPFFFLETFRLTTLHLWFESFFQLFLIIFIAFLFTLLGFVSTKASLRLSYLSAILFLGAGILSTTHHLYFTGSSELALIISSLFASLEIVPLLLLSLMAFDFLLITRGRCIDCAAYIERGTKYALYAFLACGLWNIIGSGLFALLGHLPLLAYFASGTSLIMTHEETTLSGVFGMMALGIVAFLLRSSLANREWERIQSYVKASVVGVNLGLFLLIAIDLFPAGLIQFNDVIQSGYHHARSLQFHMAGSYHVLEEIRTLSDVIFLAMGVVPLFVACLMGYRMIKKERS